MFWWFEIYNHDTPSGYGRPVSGHIVVTLKGCYYYSQ